MSAKLSIEDEVQIAVLHSHSGLSLAAASGQLYNIQECQQCDPLSKSRSKQVERRLAKQDVQSMREVIAPKAAALQALGQAGSAQPSRYSISFSSVSSIAGSPKLPQLSTL